MSSDAKGGDANGGRADFLAPTDQAASMDAAGALDTAINSGWNVAGVSIAGPSHEVESIPCQDHHTISLQRKGWLVAIASDGAGCARSAADAAHLQAEHVAYTLREYLTHLPMQYAPIPSIRDVLTGILASTRQLLYCKAAEKGQCPDDFLATIVGLVANQSAGFFFHIGDGAAVGLRSQSFENLALSKPENGEYPNETFFLIEDDWQQHLRIVEFGPELDTFLLMTDGCTDFMLAAGMDSVSNHIFPALHSTMKTSGEIDRRVALSQFLNRPDIRNISDDDKTLIWAHRA